MRKRASARSPSFSEIHQRAPSPRKKEKVKVSAGRSASGSASSKEDGWNQATPSPPERWGSTIPDPRLAVPPTCTYWVVTGKAGEDGTVRSVETKRAWGRA